MVIPKQYPYDLWQHKAGGDSIQDAQGNWIANPGSWAKLGKCRDEVNSKGAQYAAIDGTFHLFEFLILLPKSATMLVINTDIEVRDGDTVRAKGSIKNIYKSQLNTQIWI